MDRISLILSFVFLASMLLLIGPNIFAFNRGKVLRNVALWLAIFTALGLIYKTFGPGSAHPLFSLPPGIAQYAPGEPPNDATNTAKPDDDKTNGSQGYTPPAE